MRFHPAGSGFLFFALWSGSAFADAAGDREEFNNVYKAYQHLVAEGREKDALQPAQLAYELGGRVYGPDHKNTAALAVNYGKVLVLNGKFPAAIEVLQSAVTTYEKSLGKDAPELIDPLMELGRASANYFDYRPQQRIYERALAIAKRRDGPDSLPYARLLLEAGMRMLESASDEGLDYVYDARDIFEDKSGETDPWTGTAEYYIGMHFAAKRKNSQAEKHLVQALKSYKDPDKPVNRMEIFTHQELIRIYQTTRRPGLATRHCQAVGRVTPYNPLTYQPVYAEFPVFVFKDSAKRIKKQSAVTVSFIVDETGSVRDPEIVTSTGDTTLERDALAKVKNWRYAPRFVDGEPVATEVKFRVSYREEDKPHPQGTVSS